MFTWEDFQNEARLYGLKKRRLIEALLVACDELERRTSEADLWRARFIAATERAPWPIETPESLPRAAVLDVWPGDDA